MKTVLIITLFITLNLLNGCSILPDSNRDKLTKKEFELHCQWRREKIEEFKKYIGFKKEEIFEIFGEPDHILNGSSGQILRFIKTDSQQGKYILVFFLDSSDQVFKLDVI